MIVDDGRQACEALATLLKLNGHKVEVAFDGPTGISLASAFLPNVVLIDIGLPDMSGFDVLKTLADKLTETLFIAATGREDDGKSIAAGFHFHTVKPVNVDELEDLLSN